jgi:MoxR-like ATPases
MFSVGVEYPAFDEEIEIVRSTTSGRQRPLEKVLTPEQIVRYQDLVLRVPVADHVIRYAVRLVQATRPDNPGAPEAVKKYVAWGAGPRASQYLILAGKARAVLHGHDAVSADDVRALAPYVLQHRVLPSFQAEAERVTSLKIVEEVLRAVPERA